MGNFLITFADRTKIRFEDIIDLTSTQKGLILSKALNLIQEEVKNEKYGLKITITSNQEKVVLAKKNQIISNQSSLELYESQVVEFTEHSVERIIKRYKGDQLCTYLAAIEHLKRASQTSDTAEWKGFKSLSYTFLHTIKKKSDKIVVIFIRKGTHLKIITVMNDWESDSMDYRLSEDEDLTRKMLQLKNELKDIFKN